MVALRNSYSSLIVDLAREAVITGAPINRPIWWIDPTDKEAMKVDSGRYVLIDIRTLLSSIFFQNKR